MPKTITLDAVKVAGVSMPDNQQNNEGKIQEIHKNQPGSLQTGKVDKQSR